MLLFFFFNDTATTEIYTLSLHDALPICELMMQRVATPEEPEAEMLLPFLYNTNRDLYFKQEIGRAHVWTPVTVNNLVCRLLLEKKKKHNTCNIITTSNLDNFQLNYFKLLTSNAFIYTTSN